MELKLRKEAIMSTKYKCNICSKKYNTQAGLWKHKQKCEVTETEPNAINMILDIVKQNNDFKEIIIEQNKQIIEQGKQIIELSSKHITTNSNDLVIDNEFL